MAGTRTVTLEMDGLQIDADDVLATIDAPAWRTHDAVRIANTTPASMGLLRRMLVAAFAGPE